MRIFIEGGHRLKGEVRINGAKNAALPIMAATLLTSDECILENVPCIEDVKTMGMVLRSLGAEVEADDASSRRLSPTSDISAGREDASDDASSRHIEAEDEFELKRREDASEGPHRFVFRARGVDDCRVSTELATKMRASFLAMGPLLARFGHAEAPHPGGCAIGTRPVSVDIKGFTLMGADIRQSDGYYVAEAQRLVGRRIILDYPSHTGTENLLMAACLARGETIIENASVEPEVIDLANFLRAMGARIRGAGTGIIEVEGVERLHGTAYRVMPDRIEAGTFAIAAAITGGSVVLNDVIPRYLGALTSKLVEAGVMVQEEENRFVVTAGMRLLPVDIQTFPYPGFPTDLQAPFGALMTQAHGESTIHETMYDDRLLYVGELRKMGAQIEVKGQTALISGPTPLKGASLWALDIRSGAAVILAGLVAEGLTTISDVFYIDRGYERVDERLASLGARVWRSKDDEGSPF